jgi:2,4-didehydro-3-deoxy-L-rhamnonate hydrolase
MATVWKLATFTVAGCAPFGALVVKDQALALSAVAALLEQQGLHLRGDGSTLTVLDDWVHNQPLLQQAAEALVSAGSPQWAKLAVPVRNLRFEAPVRSRNIICAGANYFQHVVDLIVAQPLGETSGMTIEQRRAFGVAKMTERKKSGTPFYFIKANSTMVGPYDDVTLAPDITTMDWEFELGVVIGKRTRFVSVERALEYVAGYMCVNDLTIRERVNRKDLKEMGMDWVGSKCAPTALPMGPYLVPARFVGDPQKLHLTLQHNGHLMQNEGTSDMIFDCAQLIAALSKFMILEPGDLLCTGSPSGNGMHHGVMLKVGDTMEGAIAGPLEGLGTQRNACVAELL